MDPRAAAAKVVERVVRQGRSLGDALESVRPGQERALVQELAYGVLRWHARLDAVTGRLLERPLKAKDADIRQLILVGLYQILEMRTPAHAAVAETAGAARALGKSWAVGLINALLRRFLRERDELLAAVDADPAVRHAHPGWLVERLRAAYPDDWQRVLEQNNLRPPMTLRVNRLRLGRDDYLARLAEAGIAAGPGPAPEAITLEAPVAVERLPGFAEGLVSVQDAAAQQVAALLDVPAGARVLDACAAPGGKTCHLAERYPQLAELLALDIEPARLQRVRQNVERLQLPVRIVAGDAGDPEAWWDGQCFDRILLDAPCTGTGVIRRHPDIKWLRRPGDVDALAATQLRLLEALWPLVKPGGKLVYATCSVLPDENERLIERFLAAHADASAEALPAIRQGHRYGRQILPGEQGMDGFYYAGLIKQR